MDSDSITVNLCNFKGTCVSEGPLPFSVNDDDNLQNVTAEEVSELNQDEYQAYTTYDESDRKSLIAQMRIAKVCVLLCLIILVFEIRLAYVLYLDTLCVILWITPFVLILSYILLYTYEDLLVYINSFFLDGIVVLAFAGIMCYSVFVFIIFITNNTILLFVLSFLLLCIAIYFFISYNKIVMICKVYEVHRFIPYFDDDDLKSVKREERFCGLLHCC